MSLFCLSEKKKIRVKQCFMLVFFESFIQRQRYFPAVQIFFSLPLVLNPMSPSRSWPSWSRNTWRLSAHWPWWGTALAQVSCSPRRLGFFLFCFFRNARLSLLSWQCASSPRLLRGRRAGGFPRRPQSEGGQHGRRGPHGDGGPAVWDEGEGAEAWGNPHRFLHHPNPSLSWLWSCDCVRVYRRCRKFLQSSSPLPLWLVMPSEPWDPTTQSVLLGH